MVSRLISATKARDQALVWCTNMQVIAHCGSVVRLHVATSAEKLWLCICFWSLNTLITQHSRVPYQMLSAVAQSFIAAKNGQPED